MLQEEPEALWRETLTLAGSLPPCPPPPTSGWPAGAEERSCRSLRVCGYTRRATHPRAAPKMEFLQLPPMTHMQGQENLSILAGTDLHAGIHLTTHSQHQIKTGKNRLSKSEAKKEVSFPTNWASSSGTSVTRESKL